MLTDIIGLLTLSFVTRELKILLFYSRQFECFFKLMKFLFFFTKLSALKNVSRTLLEKMLLDTFWLIEVLFLNHISSSQNTRSDDSGY